MAEFDPYATLGVATDAPEFVIQAAYRACIKKYHPDHYSGSDARQRTADILEAYRLIGSLEARSEFDRSHQGRQPDEEFDRGRRSGGSDGESTGTSSAPTSDQLSPKKTSVSIWLTGLGILFGLTLTWNLARMSSSREHKYGGATPTANGSAIGIVPLIPPTPAPPSLPVLDEIISFTNPAKCEMSPKTEKLFDNLIKFDPPAYVGKRGSSVTLAGFSGALTPVFLRKVDQGPGLNVRDNEATLATIGLWHGLKVSKIRVRYMEESSFWEHQVRFLEPASRVRSKLNELGFELPAIGNFREFTGEDVVSAGIGVEEIQGGSALTCGSSVYY